MSPSDVLGIIPARGGSKAIPHKNLALVAGRSLLAWTCEAARQSARLTRVVVSTDDPVIARAASELGVESLARPAAIAADDTPMLDVVRHALAELQRRDGYDPPFLVVLQPTSPLRRAEHVDRAVELLVESGADAVVSVVQVPHQFTPGSVMRFKDGRLTPFVEAQSGPQIRQQKPVLFARNGPAVLAVKSASARRQGLYEGDLRALIMERSESIDIDDATDLRLAEFWLREGVGTNRAKPDA